MKQNSLPLVRPGVRAAFVAFASLALSVGSALAGSILVDLSDTAPTNPLLEINVPTGSMDFRMIRNWTNPARGAGYHRETGQTFQVPDGPDYQIDAFTLRIYDPKAAAGKTFSVYIYEVGNATNATPIGPALYEGNGELPGGMAALDYITFTFDTPFIAEAGHYYSIQIGFNGSAAGSSDMSFVMGPSSLYTGGTSFYFENPLGSTTMGYSSHNADLNFSISGTAIPEPGTVGFVIGGALLCGLVAHQRRSRGAASV